MKPDIETKQRLLASAKAEFLENGYAKASLRKICANAELTTGALYFFFKDKEDLFGAIVEEPFAELMGIVSAHFFEDESYFDEHDSYTHTHGDHDELVGLLIHHLYANYDAFILLLTKAEGTCYQGAVDRVAELVGHSTQRVLAKLAATMNGVKVNDYIVHWLTHVTVDSFIYLLTHEKDEKKAVLRMKRIIEHIIKGYTEITLVPEDEEQ